MTGATTRADGERRLAARAALHLSVQIEGCAPDGERWSATSTTADASAGGARFTLRRAVSTGNALRLVLPMPRALRDRDHWETDYEVWGLVRHVERGPDGSWDVGVMFYGRSPPRGYEDDPGGRFLLPGDVPSVAPEPMPHGDETGSEAALLEEAEAGHGRAQADSAEERSEERFEIFVNLMLQEMDEFGAVLREEVTVAENLSLNGARVLTSHRFARGNILILQEVEGDFCCRAEVRYVWVGSDRIRRLNLKFLDGRQPTHLLPRS